MTEPSGWAFPASEYHGRWERARRAMRERGVDALVVTSEHNYDYFSGHDTLAWLLKARPFFMLLPLQGEPALVVPRSHAPQARFGGVVADIRTYDGFEDEARQTLVDLVFERGLASASLGMELGLEQRPGLRPNDLESMRRTFPTARFVDAAPIVWDLRMRKSEAEIVHLRQACRITAEAFGVVLAEIEPGWTERQAYQRFLAETIARGAERIGYVVMNGGPGNFERRTGWPGDRRFQAGELFWLDGGCVFRGYWADYARLGVLGEPTSGQGETHRFVYDTLQEALQEVRPGVGVGAVMQRAIDAFERAARRLGVAARLGHGVGLDITEPPYVMPTDLTVLEAGMVITIEPSLLTDEGWFHLEEQIVVRESGYEYLSEPSPSELQRLPLR